MKSEDLDLLLELWYPISFIPDENCHQSLKNWLTSGDYLIANQGPNISLFCSNVDDLKKCFSFDAFQFSIRTKQTVNEFVRSSPFPKMTSWGIIKVYYAAFFAAHAILRFFGRAFSHLETDQFTRLSALWKSQFSNSLSISAGDYHILLNQNNLEFKKFSESHKDLWRNFLALVLDISNQSLSLRANDQRKQLLSRQFSDIAEALTDDGRHPVGNFLSVIRNEVNYKSMEVVWFPFSKDTPDFATLISGVRGWANCQTNLHHPRNLKNRYERFFVSAFLVIDLGISISVQYTGKISKPGARSKNFLKLLKLCAR